MKPSAGPARSASSGASNGRSSGTSTSATAYPADQAASCAPRIVSPKNGA